MTNNRPPAVIMLFLISAFLSVFAGCRFLEKKPSGELPFEGLKLVVWDTVEPSFSRAESYQELIELTVAEFSGKYGAQVDIEFVSREHIFEFLYGESDVAQPPSVVYSTECPALPKGAEEISSSTCSSDYLDQAVDYWSPQGQLMGVPAYVHWVGKAIRVKRQDGDEISSGLGFWPDSQWFLASAIDFPDQGFKPDAAISYLEWLKDTFKDEQEEPLDAWEAGRVDSLWPVTPHMYCWLKSAFEGQVTLGPIENPFDDPRFYCSVPGYIALSHEDPEKSCAILLAKTLARKRGIWAARNIGAIPAAVEDVVIYDLEAPLNQDEKRLIRDCSEKIPSQCLTAQEALRRRQIWQGFARVTEEFLGGAIPSGGLNQRIFELWESHTKP